MNFTPDLSQIPHWQVLKKICKAQSVLDLLICGQEFETYHRYMPSSKEEYEGQEARIGFDFEEEDGPSLHLFFTEKGCIIVPSVCENFQATSEHFEKQIPKDFQSFYRKNYQEQEVPFVIYAQEDKPWQLLTNFEIEQELFTLKHLCEDPEFYKDWATIFFGEETEYLNDDASTETIEALYQGKILTEKMVYTIVSGVQDWLFLEEELNRIPYRFDF